MANNYPDGGEQPLGPIERKVLPWLAWLLCTFVAGALIMLALAQLPFIGSLVAGLAGFTAGGVFAAWALRPWSS
ncbi:hypothetical protein ASD21_15985 [Caulobacter sp. Root1455]|jgi:hypothetical protein|uniref:hypothetical protein n=1 Tax=unclassified Caulobacter TaxID=2648921 RepID=UPI0006FBA28F|nr:MULTISPECIES: hypothetical protein [unclassified Caulobacter]KQY28292.1 hypothetical protein ASD38_16545 [Caulobacter sp. Root487D2Y]KQY91809.1 hypothetical protein ASD21_15985 [Caulobacter sp. Root1455]